MCLVLLGFRVSPVMTTSIPLHILFYGFLNRRIIIPQKNHPCNRRFSERYSFNSLLSFSVTSCMIFSTEDTSLLCG